ncbi:hypothetical protein [Natrinema salaciae]|nr:hypothetical protein [Natrinema salaciae]
MCEESGASDDAHADKSDEPTSLPTCPVCGGPITTVTATGPDTGTVRPCGCSVPPCVIRYEGDDPEFKAGPEPETGADTE